MDNNTPYQFRCWWTPEPGLADDDFIDGELVKEYNILIQTLSSPREVLAVDGRLIERVTQKTEPLKLILSSNHHEFIELHVISSPMNSVILGIPWLKLHNPHVDWATATIRNWSLYCHAHCLHSAQLARSTEPSPAPEEIDLTKVSSDYHDLKQVFSKLSDTSLPPHRPYDSTRTSGYGEIHYGITSSHSL